ncbi:PREDICTED: uncharacterized protein LOC108778173 [Cyphomyrmex costatus]|uniref:uncharacterized protein LOC108775106 n=1 Tax=Cyphomyrmex costatus TaxID=456900 RepID=UPI0008523AC4|nr:PREDICTED: uncharacterized protein LOC108775106 [Cyphomyrmex costatus]XP_018398210.1 PREDICTED: uncharacterized protein LOC108776175 [Cyphomyrmex costatus]XP_018400784.1 PREDICTED: uncharacterized protein LOC108778173 [Cyphomyrmex costatus]
MKKLRFEFVVKSETDPKTNVLAITSIETPQGEIYKIPVEYQNIRHHEKLTTTETFKRIKTTLKLRHQSRRVWITLNEELRDTYLDEDENLKYEQYYLEEITNEPTSTSTTEDTLKRFLEESNVKKAIEKFVIEKFTGKNVNGVQWLETFEKECNRLKIQKDEEKIEILRLFLESSCLDWYSSMLIKHSITSEWEIWKNNFHETYADKGWSSIKYAISYKYISGSLLDYALKKEKLLLEVNKAIDTCTLIDLMAVGLPEFIINRIDRQKLRETEDLFRELRSLEHMIKKKNTENKNFNKYIKDDSEKKQQKRPCKICEKKGKMNRFHPESACWFKANENDNKEKNQIKFVNNTELESELVTLEQKNL